MKRTSVLMLLVATLISSVAFAKTKPLETKVGSSASFAIIPKVKQKKFDLVYVSQSKAPVTISLYDMEGNKLSSEKVKGHSSFIKTFDMSELNNGNYVVEVENEEGRAIERITHRDAKPDFNVMLTQSGEDKLKLMVAGYKYESPVQLKIYDEGNRVVHSENINVGKDFIKTYDLSKLGTEYVTFEVINNKSFVYKSSEL